MTNKFLTKRDILNEAAIRRRKLASEDVIAAKKSANEKDNLRLKRRKLLATLDYIEQHWKSYIQQPDDLIESLNNYDNDYLKFITLLNAAEDMSLSERYPDHQDSKNRRDDNARDQVEKYEFSTLTSAFSPDNRSPRKNESSNDWVRREPRRVIKDNNPRGNQNQIQSKQNIVHINGSKNPVSFEYAAILLRRRLAEQRRNLQFIWRVEDIKYLKSKLDLLVTEYDDITKKKSWSKIILNSFEAKIFEIATDIQLCADDEKSVSDYRWLINISG